MRQIVRRISLQFKELFGAIISYDKYTLVYCLLTSLIFVYYLNKYGAHADSAR